MWWQPAARGHRAFTDLSAARVWGQSYMHSLQPCQLGNDSLLNMFPIPPLGRCMEGPLQYDLSLVWLPGQPSAWCGWMGCILI